MRGMVGRRLIVSLLPGTVAIGVSVPMRSICVMVVTARCLEVLLSRGCATRPINNGVQPRRTRWKKNLPKYQQPCEVLSAMLWHALWAREVEFQKLRARPVTRTLLHAYVTNKGKSGKNACGFSLLTFYMWTCCCSCRYASPQFETCVARVQSRSEIGISPLKTP